MGSVLFGMRNCGKCGNELSLDELWKSMVNGPNLGDVRDAVEHERQTEVLNKSANS